MTTLGDEFERKYPGEPWQFAKICVRLRSVFYWSKSLNNAQT